MPVQAKIREVEINLKEPGITEKNGKFPRKKRALRHYRFSQQRC